MNSFYDVVNKGKKGMWMSATDRVDAALIAQQFGHVREMEHATVCGPYDQMNGEPGLKEILEAGLRGQLVKDLVAVKWMLIKEATPC